MVSSFGLSIIHFMMLNWHLLISIIILQQHHCCIDGGLHVNNLPSWRPEVVNISCDWRVPQHYSSNREVICCCRSYHSLLWSRATIFKMLQNQENLITLSASDVVRNRKYLFILSQLLWLNLYRYAQWYILYGIAIIYNNYFSNFVEYKRILV